jgi:hypothetical protein
MTHTLWRKNPVNGFVETIEYCGPLSQKPKGWKLFK